MDLLRPVPEKYAKHGELLTEHKSSHVAVVFDPKGKTFRHEFDSNYKANRTKMPEELAEQIPTLHELIRAMGFPLIIKSGYEADDVIGTLTKQAEAAGMRVSEASPSPSSLLPQAGS